MSNRRTSEGPGLGDIAAATYFVVASSFIHGGWIAALGVGLVALTSGRDEPTNYQQATKLISHLDSEPGTSNLDWAIAYRDALGSHFDMRESDPARLPKDDLRLIIDHYSPETEE